MSRLDSLRTLLRTPSSRCCLPLLALLFALSSATLSHGMTDIYQLFQTTGDGTDMSDSRQIYGPNASYYSWPEVYDIGFEFIYDGKSYSTFSVNTSGLMSLGTQTYPYPESYLWPNGLNYHPMLAAVWLYYSAPSENGQVHYKVSGTAPNQVLTVEWQDVYVYNYTGYAGGTWQIRLHEGSNLIEFWYGDYRIDYNYWPTSMGMTSSASRYINIWGNQIDQYYLYPSGQYYWYRYMEDYPMERNTIFQFSSCDRELAGIVGNVAQGGTKGMVSGKDTLLTDKQVMRGNTTTFQPFSFDLPDNPCSAWTYNVSLSGPGAADYTISGNGSLINEKVPFTINFTPQAVGVRNATMTLTISNGEQFVYQLKGEGLSRMARIGTVAEGGTVGMNNRDTLLKNIDVARGSRRDLRPFRINNINTAPTNKGLTNANVLFTLDDPYNQYTMRLESTETSEKGAALQAVTNLAAVVTPGKSVTPVITFAPTPQGKEQGTGVQPATLTVNADGEIYTYIISGFSVAPVAEFYFNNLRLISSNRRLFVNEITCTGEQASYGTFVIDNINKVPVTINSANVFLTESTVRQGTPPYPQQLDAFGRLIPVLDYFISENPTVAPYKANTIATFPITIQPGTRKTLYFGFVSQRPGRRFARIFLNTNAVNFAGKEVGAYMPGTNPADVPDKEGMMALDLFGNGIGGHLAKNAEGTLNGLSMIFNPIEVTSSTTSETWIHNTGDCDMRINQKDLRLISGDVNEFELLEVLPNTSVDATGDFVIPPGGSDKITARFTPSRSGSRRASVMLRTNDSTLSVTGVTDRGTYFLDLFGTGKAYLEAPSVKLAPAVIDGPSSRGAVRVINAATEAITITAAQLSGPNVAEIMPDPARPWPTLPLTLKPGERAQFGVVMTPATGSLPGERSAMMTFTIRDGMPVSTQITGMVGTRTIVANPASMFRTTVIPVGSTKREYAVLTNAGTFPIHIDRIAIIGAAAADYKLGTLTRMDLDPGESQFIEVTYTPTAAGTSTAQIEITSNATNGTQLIDLGASATGTGQIGTPATGTAISSGSGAARSVAANGMMIASVVPNPAKDKATISYTLAGNGAAEIVLYDVAGRQALRLSSPSNEAGEYAVQADLSNLESGVYYVTVRQNNQVVRQTIVVTR